MSSAALTPEMLADLRKKAEAARDRNLVPGEEGVHVVEADPVDVLGLLDRIEELEAKWERPSTWKCDGCGCVVREPSGRRPGSHPSCGGVWIRQEERHA